MGVDCGEKVKERAEGKYEERQSWKYWVGPFNWETWNESGRRAKFHALTHSLSLAYYIYINKIM